MSLEIPATRSAGPPERHCLPPHGEGQRLLSSVIRAYSTVSEQSLFNGIPSESLAPALNRYSIMQLRTDDIRVRSGQYREYLKLLVVVKVRSYLDAIDSQIDASIRRGRKHWRTVSFEDGLTKMSVLALADITRMTMRHELFGLDCSFSGLSW